MPPRLQTALLALLLALPLSGQETRPVDRPTAWVLEHRDRWTGAVGAADLLRASGFDVRPLPLDRPPDDLEGLVFLGSFSSEHPGYGAFVRRHAAGLRRFVEDGNVLLQMTQADQVEGEPPFLPDALEARRSDDDFDGLCVLAPESPLLDGIPTRWGRLVLAGPRTGWEAFQRQRGFQVVLAGDEAGRRPALLEGALGRGRIVLVAMSFDKTTKDGEPVSPPGRDAFARGLLRNLARHVAAVREGRAAPIAATPPPPEPRPFTQGSWTLAVLPDTQIYSLRYPGLFSAQTAWIVQNRERLDIRYVLHLGDVVDDNTPVEWRRARDAMGLLDGHVPWVVAPGNHDYGPGGDASTRETGLNTFFDAGACAQWPTFGGAMEPGKLDNTYHLFEAGGHRWIVVALEWAPRDETVAWADGVMRKHDDRLGILITHAYMNNDDRRYDHTDTEHSQLYNPHLYDTPGSKNDGQELWDELVRHHRFVLVMNGHVLGDGTGYLASRTDLGNTCHQMLSNYQMRRLGGEGYLRLLEMLPDGRTVVVRSYSPLYDSYLLAPDQQLTLKLDGTAPARR